MFDIAVTCEEEPLSYISKLNTSDNKGYGVFTPSKKAAPFSFSLTPFTRLVNHRFSKGCENHTNVPKNIDLSLLINVS